MTYPHSKPTLISMKKTFLIVTIICIVGFIYWALSPLSIKVTVDEPLPLGNSNQTHTESSIAVSLAETGVAVKTLETESTVPQAPIVPLQTQRTSKASLITGTVGHPASGTVRIVEADGTKYLRYENFHTINGPDLFVYLASNTKATEFINLGALKATDGNVNYAIPAGTDVSKYTHALVWCKSFGVLFNSAELD